MVGSSLGKPFVDLNAAKSAEVSARLRALAEQRGWVAPGEHLLYGRYDLVQLDDGSQALLEAELFEPSFFLQVDPGAPERLVQAVRRRALQVAGQR